MEQAILYHASPALLYKLVRLNKKWYAAYRRMNIWTYLAGITNKSLQLQMFLNFYKYLPIQGSIAWKKARSGDATGLEMPTIGGSEIGSILGMNDYQKEYQLVSSKLGITGFDGSPATRWGNLFEEVASMLMECWYGTVTYETGSIPGASIVDPNNLSSRVIQTYSPDRLGVLDIQRLRMVMDSLGILSPETRQFLQNWPLRDITALFEFKCPSSRIPNTEIPKQYQAQPLVGACTIPITDICLFVDSMIRKCSIDDFGFNTDYDSTYTPKDPPAVSSEGPIVCGMVGIYDIPNPASPEDSDDESEKTPTYKPPLSNAEFEEIIPRLANYVKQDLFTEGSEFYSATRHTITMSDVMFLVSLCDKFLNVLYTEAPMTIRQMTVTLEEQLTFRAIRDLIGDMTVVQEDFLRVVLQGAMRVNYQLRRNYDMTSLEYGHDLGGAANYLFDEIIKKTINDRFENYGFKAYYTPGFYTLPGSAGALGMKQAASYVDMTLPEPQRAQKWLWQRTEEFTKFCKAKGYEPVGIIPWKLFKISMIPLLKDPEYLTRIMPKLVKVWNTIRQIKEAAYARAQPVSKEVLIQEYEKVYPPSTKALARRATKKIGSPSTPVANSGIGNWDAETLNFDI